MHQAEPAFATLRIEATKSCIASETGGLKLNSPIRSTSRDQARVKGQFPDVLLTRQDKLLRHAKEKK